MKVSDFDFHLPERLIALRPAQPRDSARLLRIGGGHLDDLSVADLPGQLRRGDVMVFNDTRVIPARLFGVRPADGARGEAHVELLLHKREAADAWRAFARPGKRLRVGDVVRAGADGSLAAEVVEKGEGGEILVRFDRAAAELDAALAALGEMPLPPYIASKRAADESDLSDYQTRFAARDGAVAAPTAGLHFTDRLMERLAEAGIGQATVTLHVGAGTFLPVKAEDIADHRMHAEWGEVAPETAEALNRARRDGGRIVAVGTTSLRLLESATGADGVVRPFTGDTDIFITPGYRFRAVDVLTTNFHLPKSTLFMLVSAFAGLETMKAAYGHAVAAEYRFYSYGDACLLFPGEA
ncbi:MAG: tRNA preQ1(34) S-adenosylmethionine ribosyltransferase-isomerase QueA [Alphaproteobacteria bacterium]|nr:tRNA preQ1(34) S-adenosylmethionine ribosyltransferase-isomerase QueA [Alphaproteobacteria bacterium]